MEKTKTYFLFLCCMLFMVSCINDVGTNPERAEVENTFQALLEETINTSFESVPGISMTVKAPKFRIDWTGVSGFDSKTKEDTLSAAQPFRIASVTKTFVAVAILRLHEMGKLSIEDPIEKHISSEHIQLLKKGGYAPDSITLRHCLNHTSGLYDYALGGGSYLELAAKDAKKRWTRTEQLKLAMESGNRKGYPGERYSYCDTGYILLGEAIETTTDSTLSWGLRSLLGFDEMGMHSTWLESLEPAPNGLKAEVHRYLRGVDYTDWDPSVDLYGGGGLVSITEDLTLFFQNLFNHKIFDKKETLDLMLEKRAFVSDEEADDRRRFKDYRQGLWEIDIYGKKGYMHNGIWGTQLLHVPELNCTVSLNYTHGQRDRLMKKTVLVVDNLAKKKGSK